MTRVAWIGTGLMGAPMARRLLGAGHEARAWNQTAAKAEGFGAIVAGSPAQAVSGLVLDAARAARIELALPALVREPMGKAIELGHGEDDLSATFLATCPELS